MSPRGPGSGGGGSAGSKAVSIGSLTSYGVPHNSEGSDGDTMAAITQNGLVLYYKFDGIWFYLSHLKKPTADGQSVDIGRGRDATFKELFAENMNSNFCISWPFYHNHGSNTSYTYFRDADDTDDIFGWGGIDTEDSTTVGATATITAGNAMSGITVPYDCMYKGFHLNIYQASSASNRTLFQTWTGIPPNDTDYGTTTITLRTTNSFISLRKSFTIFVPAKIKMSAGSMLYPAFKPVLVSSPIWYGNATFVFEKDIKNIKVKNK